MAWRITTSLVRDHEEIPALLDACITPSGEVDLQKFDDFRHRLLRHIAIEEKVLRRALVKKLGVEPLFQNGLRRDHAGIASLCVPLPNREWLENLKEQLAHHNRVEEAPGGFYELVEKVCDPDELLKQIAAMPEVKLPPFQTGHGVREQFKRVLIDTGIKDVDEG